MNIERIAIPDPRRQTHRWTRLRTPRRPLLEPCLCPCRQRQIRRPPFGGPQIEQTWRLTNRIYEIVVVLCVEFLREGAQEFVYDCRGGYRLCCCRWGNRRSTVLALAFPTNRLTALGRGYLSNSACLLQVREYKLPTQLAWSCLRSAIGVLGNDSVANYLSWCLL